MALVITINRYSDVLLTFSGILKWSFFPIRVRTMIDVKTINRAKKPNDCGDGASKKISDPRIAIRIIEMTHVSVSLSCILFLSKFFVEKI